MYNHHIAAFLQDQCPSDARLLIALSGGADSMFLLFSLIECCKKIPITLEIAHVDHGWRQESSLEAEELRLLANRLHIPFHLKTLDPNQLQGNLEAACREERYRFFREICSSRHCFGVLLGHHYNDRVETILKRLFEGAHWSHLNALQPKISIDGLLILRPLLHIKKNTIIQELESREIRYFTDMTNFDERFNRSRIRQTLLPSLSNYFGKEIDGNLVLLGSEMDEITEFFNCRLKQRMDHWISESTGHRLDLESPHDLQLVELKWLIRKKIEALGLFLSREIINEGAKAWKEGTKHVQFKTKSTCLRVDRNRIVISPLKILNDNRDLC